MSVDIIIPVRNGDAYIGDCLNSVLNQSAFSRISRIIVIDDGSEDSTVEIVGKFIGKNRLVEIHSTKPNGLSAARNYGLALSTSENIAFLDSDDLWIPDKIENHFNHLREHAGCLFSFTLASEFHNDPKIITSQGINAIDPTFDSILLQQFRIFGSGSSVFVNRSLALLKGGFDEGLKFGEDWDFWLKLAQNQLPCQLNENSTLIRLHPLSMQRTRRDGDDRFLNSSIHFHEWAKYPHIFQDSRFKDVAFRIMWADFRKNFGISKLFVTDYCNYLFLNYRSIMKMIGLPNNRMFNSLILFQRIKMALRGLKC